MFHSILNLLMGCRHARYSSLPRADKLGRPVVTCADCGRQFFYDWPTMRVTGPVDQAEVLAPCPVEAARRAL